MMPSSISFSVAKLLNPANRAVAQIETLRGKILGCWCCPLECHGEVLLEILYPPVTLENFWE